MDASTAFSVIAVLVTLVAAVLSFFSTRWIEARFELARSSYATPADSDVLQFATPKKGEAPSEFRIFLSRRELSWRAVIPMIGLAALIFLIVLLLRPWHYRPIAQARAETRVEI